MKIILHALVALKPLVWFKSRPSISGVSRICEWGVFARHARRYAHAQKYFGASPWAQRLPFFYPFKPRPLRRALNRIFRARVRQARGEESSAFCVAVLARRAC